MSGLTLATLHIKVIQGIKQEPRTVFLPAGKRRKKKKDSWR
jgi:hypothetical protein